MLTLTYSAIFRKNATTTRDLRSRFATTSHRMSCGRRLQLLLSVASLLVTREQWLRQLQSDPRSRTTDFLPQPSQVDRCNPRDFLQTQRLMTHPAIHFATPSQVRLMSEADGRKRPTLASGDTFKLFFSVY